MPNTRQSSKIGREKMTDESSIEHIIDKHGGHVNDLQLGTLSNRDLQGPLTEQERRNRAEGRRTAEPESDEEKANRGPRKPPPRARR